MAQDLSRSQVELDPLQILAKSTPIKKTKKITGFEDVLTGMRSCKTESQLKRISSQKLQQTHL